MKRFKRFFFDESGASTAEVVIIISVLVGVALLFRKVIWNWTGNMLESLLPGEDNFNNVNNVINTKQ
jgi:Flp pilus assembly pilin Flp